MGATPDLPRLRSRQCDRQAKPRTATLGPPNSALSRSVEPALARRVADKVDPGFKSQLFHAAPLVGFHGFDADLKLRGDLLVAVACGSQFQHFALSLAQVGARADFDFMLLRRSADQPPGDQRVDVEASLGDRANRPDQLVAR